VLKKGQCHDIGRTICLECAGLAYKLADPGNFKNRIPKFGVTPICDSCADVPEPPEDRVIGYHCTGPPIKDGEKSEKLCLCLECRIAYNMERFQAADDRARSYLYMRDDKHGGIEYLPGMQIDCMKMSSVSMWEHKAQFGSETGNVCLV
jgi:hypothetical protein